MLSSIQDYTHAHPGHPHDPTPLELYCEANPDADECRVYDD
ncbi:MAG: CP12 domain-containing protein [Cyanobacteriota bacterium]|nr:CP12 domain-containing protein [Cyanobacteriota bacterium]